MKSIMEENEMVEVTLMWMAPDEYATHPDASQYPDGVFTAFLPNGTVLEVTNATREQAETKMAEFKAVESKYQ